MYNQPPFFLMGVSGGGIFVSISLESLPLCNVVKHNFAHSVTKGKNPATLRINGARPIGYVNFGTCSNVPSKTLMSTL
ncbi:hypothetical protein FRC0411_00629 [Corynebacterium diphtheriae]|nr:hypothetical protein CIP107521_00640 [Corynebacterium diphtheriae]CAB0589466.1 hypothetical protein CIP107536_00557 [Corynebacterium diphtheriae]CAB0680244.1 hypothetical protein FRC0084_00437 [Corynebacterium diphtheriae]CAB0724505.1 hypothetical protein FRC0095_00492 [Corynebacterium diphtheriae]CAB0787994.1 hypothetical protein FRC0261_00402 [Corynebacterium diphtheriae]